MCLFSKELFLSAFNSSNILYCEFVLGDKSLSCLPLHMCILRLTNTHWTGEPSKTAAYHIFHRAHYEGPSNGDVIYMQSSLRRPHTAIPTVHNVFSFSH